MSPSILKIQRRQSTFWKAHQTFNLFLMHFMSFINYQKSKMIFKSSLNSHVYWDTLQNLFLNPSIISSFCLCHDNTSENLDFSTIIYGMEGMEIQLQNNFSRMYGHFQKSDIATLRQEFLILSTLSTLSYLCLQ